MTTTFQSNAFQNNAFQVTLSPNRILYGGLWARGKKPKIPDQQPADYFADLGKIYDSLVANPSTRKAAKKAAKKYAVKAANRLPKAQTIDFLALSKDLEAAKELIRLYVEIEDEEIFMMMN